MECFEPKNILKGELKFSYSKSLTEEQVTVIYERFKKLVDSWNGTSIDSIETTEDPNCYWLTFGGECDFDTLNVQGYIPCSLVDDILAEAKTKETITE